MIEKIRLHAVKIFKQLDVMEFVHRFVIVSRVWCTGLEFVSGVFKMPNASKLMIENRVGRVTCHSNGGDRME